MKSCVTGNGEKPVSPYLRPSFLTISDGSCIFFMCFFPGANNHAMIRILSVCFAERSLLKGFTGAVTDLAFAHVDSSLLGCVDEAGNLMVWQLTCNGDKIVYPDALQATHTQVELH